MALVSDCLLRKMCLTETSTGDSIFLSKLIVALAEFFIAENLIGFTNLSWRDGVSACLDNKQTTVSTDLLESRMRSLIAGVLIYDG